MKQRIFSKDMWERGYKRYALVIMTSVLTLSLVDRGLIMLLLQPIKEDLHLSDTQLGITTGIAFAFFYTIFGLPIARWADRGNRVTITSAAIGLWGLTMMSYTLIGTFIQLIGARITAAVGEAGCMPPTYSLVGDYFTEPAERIRAMSVYWLASPLAQLISFIAGSWFAARHGWRLTFVALGFPALLLALVCKMTIREPRAPVARLQNAARRSSTFGEVARFLWSQRSSRYLGISIILALTLSLGLQPWYAAYMVRTHRMSIPEIGTWLGAIFGVGGAAGLWLGGYIAEHWFHQSAKSQMRFVAVIISFLTPCFALFLLLPTKNQALIALVPLAVFFNSFPAPVFTLMQRLVPDDMRATALAVTFLLANLIGMGAGSLIVGVLSDKLASIVGNDSLKYAMLIMSGLALVAAACFWQVSRFVESDLLIRLSATPPP
jgi:predicted MFS family arabinose efflux permease